MDGLHRLRRGGIEIGGVLFGLRKANRIRILDRRALRCEYAQGPSFLLSDNDGKALEALMAGATIDPGLIDLEAVGWYVSHTRKAVCLSETDLLVYDRYFPQPWQITMVVRPMQEGRAEVGFFFREDDGTVRSESGYATFHCDPLLSPDRLEPETPAPDHSAISQQTPSSRRRWPWFAAAGVLALTGIGLLVHVFHLGAQDPAALSLRAEDRDGLVRIDWNRSAEPVVSAQQASLVIVDGAQNTETALSPELLKNGGVLYRRKSSEIEIRLIGLPGGKDPARLEAADAQPVSSLALKPKSIAKAPKTGRLIWTGRLSPRGALSIDGNRASTGSLRGEIPQAPVRIRAHPASLSGKAIQIFAEDLADRRQLSEPPGPGNGWIRTVYKLDPKRAAGLIVTETPSGQNKWKIVRLRARDRALTAIVLDWEALPSES